MSELTSLFFTAMMSWVRALTDRVWAVVRGEDIGPWAWIASHWIELIVIIIAIGLVADWFMWMVRWRPYRLWFSNFRRMRKGGLIAAQTFAAAPVYPQDDDSLAVDNPQIDAGTWSGEDESEDEPFQEEASEAADMEYIAEEEGGEYLDDAQRYAPLSPQDNDNDGDIIAADEGNDDDIDNVINMPKSYILSDDANEDVSTQNGEYEDIAEDISPYAQPLRDVAPLTDMWDELYNADSYESGEDDSDNIDISENIDTEYDYSGGEEEDAEYMDVDASAYDQSIDASISRWDALDAPLESPGVIRTVTGRPAKRRGLFRLTSNEDEAISGLPPMMPLEQGYNRPKLPPRRVD